MQHNKSQKQLQIAEQIKRAMANIFLHNNRLQLPNVHMTIVQADVSPDIKNAKIFINISGKVSDKNKEDLVNELNSISAYLRTELAKNISLRYTPKLRFILDSTFDNASKISDLIDKESKNI